MKITAIVSIMVCLCLGLALPAHAGMSSASYRIPTTVMSGGGGPMASASYRLNSTAGQPTPIMEDGMDPFSASYGLLPGF